MEQSNIPGEKMKHRLLLLFGTMLIVSFAIMGGIKADSTCNSQATCNTALNSTSPGDKVTVTSNFSIGAGGLLFNAVYAGDNVTFDCNGYTLTLTTTDNPLLEIYKSTGTSATDPFNITVQNCQFTGGIFGLWVESGKNHTIKNNILSDTYFDSDYTVFENNTFPGYISIRSASTSIIRNNKFTGTAAISLDASGSTGIFYNNNITASGGPVFNLNANFPIWTFYNNYIYAPSNSNYITFASNPSKFNTTNQTGPNIIGGKYTGGNYWLNSTGGFSKECHDIDNNDFCDTYLMFDSGTGYYIYDYLPLTLNLTTINITINSPLNITYGTEEIFYNITVNDTATSICLSIDNNITFPFCSYNSLILNGSITNITSGFYNWVFRANNSDGFYDWDNIFFNVSIITTPGPITNETIIFQIDPNADTTITRFSCSDNNTLRIDSNVEYCIGESGNYSANCYWVNKTKYQNCAYGCYPGVVENGDYCSPPDYILWGFGLIVFFVAIFLINRYYRGR